MKLLALAAILFAALAACTTATIDHDKIEPIPQPEPATISEKAAIKFKPQLYTPEYMCVPFPAVTAAGEVTSGLKGTKGSDGCKYALKGAQVYGRSGWYKDLWAIMYAWYFPKGFKENFLVAASLSKRHDWKSVVVWIDNPAVETPKIIGVAMSEDDEYDTTVQTFPSNFAGYRSEGRRFHYTYILGSNISLRFEYESSILVFSSTQRLKFATWDGQYQDLIMWEQLNGAARAALNNDENFGDVKVPLSETHFQENLEKAWPL